MYCNPFKIRAGSGSYCTGPLASFYIYIYIYVLLKAVVPYKDIFSNHPEERWL